MRQESKFKETKAIVVLLLSEISSITTGMTISIILLTMSAAMIVGRLLMTTTVCAVSEGGTSPH